MKDYFQLLLKELSIYDIKIISLKYADNWACNKNLLQVGPSPGLITSFLYSNILKFVEKNLLIVHSKEESNIRIKEFVTKELIGFGFDREKLKYYEMENDAESDGFTAASFLRSLYIKEGKNKAKNRSIHNFFVR